MARIHRKTVFYQLLGSQSRPRVISWNLAAWRDDVRRVNGFDERFRTWGCEDDDLGRRLRTSGVRIATALGFTHAYHLWHEPHPTTPSKWKDGLSVPYFSRPVQLTCCMEGIVRRDLGSLAVRVVGGGDHAKLTRELAARFASQGVRPEIELLLWPAPSGFSTDADHRVLVTIGDQPGVPADVRRAAHATIALGRRIQAHDVLDSLEGILAGRMSPARLPSCGGQAA
jgi:hypothetical protein